MKNYTSIRLEITSSCNLNCRYCHNQEFANQNNDMSTEEILKLVENLNESNKIKKVLLTGGEPLMKPDICKIISKLTAMGIKVDMVTNGVLLTKKKLLELQEAGLKRIRLSIDEPGENTILREGSNPEILWKKAKMIAQESDIELCVHTVCSPYNAEMLFDIYKKLLEIGAARWRVFELGYQGGSVNNKEEFEFDSYYQKYINSTKKIIKDYIKNGYKDTLDIEINNIFKTAFLNVKYSDNMQIDIEKMVKAKSEESPCNYVTDHQLTIRSDGKATLCQYFHNTIYDFKSHNYDINNTINDECNCEENTIKMKDLSYCMRCKYGLLCNSGCRSRAKYLTGNILDADPVGCYLFPKVDKEIMTLLPEGIQKIYNLSIVEKGLEPKYKAEDLRRLLKEKGYNVSEN